eukprot:1731814-Rhodomonas_salina.2
MASATTGEERGSARAQHTLRGPYARSIRVACTHSTRFVQHTYAQQIRQRCSRTPDSPQRDATQREHRRWHAPINRIPVS